jgi:hypothetical protein
MQSVLQKLKIDVGAKARRINYFMLRIFYAIIFFN